VSARSGRDNPLCPLLASSPPQNALVGPAVARAEIEVPSAAWSGDRALVADFTFDGRPGVALLGVADDGVAVAVIDAPISPRYRVLSLRLAADPSSQSGICGSRREAQIEAENPGLADECPAGDDACGSALAKRLRAAGRKGGKGVALVNNECDRFHIVFDGTRLIWTRL